MLDDRVDGLGQEVGVFLLAGRQPQVDQVGRSMVADRVPVLARLVMAQRLGARVEGDRVDVRVVAALLAIQEVLVEQVDRLFGVAQDAGIAGDAVGLDRPGQRVDLLVGGNGVVVVAELRGEDLALCAAAHIHGVIPVDDVFVLPVARICSRRYSVPFSAASR